jgi:hypothetical protein
LEFDAGDEQELVTSLSALSDQMPWTMTADHGDAFQRVQWFTLGRNGGVNACHDVLVDPSASTAPSTIDVDPSTVPTSAIVPSAGHPPRRPRGGPVRVAPSNPGSVARRQPGPTAGRPESVQLADRVRSAARPRRRTTLHG